MKNVYGRCGIGRSPVDRGRKGLKVSILTDCNGIMHNMRADPANVSDYKLFTPMRTSMLINLRRLGVSTDKGHDSKSNRQAAYVHGFLPRIIKRKCRSSRRQNGKRVRVKMAGHASEPSKAQVLWEKGDARMSWEHEMVSPTQFHDWWLDRIAQNGVWIGRHPSRRWHGKGFIKNTAIVFAVHAFNEPIIWR